MDRKDFAKRARRLTRSIGSGTAAAAPPAPGADPVRLVESPVFVLSSIRSGSTLLRVILNSHSDVCAPHELHMGSMRLKLGANATSSMEALGLSARDLENLLWDRMLDMTLRQSGKKIIVDKTPQNTFAWKRIHRMWPKARFIYLLRHPVRVAESMRAAWPNADLAEQYEKATSYAVAINEARTAVDGLTVRYEDLTTDPVAVARQLCTWLEIPFEPSITDYLSHDHGNFEGRLGDWKDTIKSGVIRPAAPDPTLDEIPEGLREASALLGYIAAPTSGEH